MPFLLLSVTSNADEVRRTAANDGYKHSKSIYTQSSPSSHARALAERDRQRQREGNKTLTVYNTCHGLFGKTDRLLREGI